MPTILFADDDQQIRELLCEFLRAVSFDVIAVCDGEEALEQLPKQQVDLILLDVMMPQLDGIATLKRIRRTSNIPIIMLTAKDSDGDKINGLEFGADDYIAKPCNPREIVARINAVLRRTTTALTNTQSVDGLELLANELKANYLGKCLELTAAEFYVLQALVAQGDEIISRDELTKQALGRELTAYDRAIDVHISNLRKKLTSVNADVTIKSIRSKGYRIVAISEPAK